MMQGALHIGTYKKASFRIIEYGGLPLQVCLLWISRYST